MNLKLAALKFIYDVVNKLEIGYNASRVAIINYSTSIKIEFYLKTYFDKTTLLKAILNIYQNITT